MPATITRRHVILLLVALFVGYALLEYGSYLRMNRPTGRGRRIDAEYREALALRPVTQGANPVPTVLLVGNSLVREGLQLDDLRQALADRYDVHRLILEATNYSDWSFTIPSLLESGSRPSFIVLALSPPQMSTPIPVSLETIHYLLDIRQIKQAARGEGGGPTVFAMHFIEHISPYWGTRNSAQSAMKDFIPGFRYVINGFAGGMDIVHPFDPKRMDSLASPCYRYGVPLVYLAMPARDPLGAAKAAPILAAARIDGVATLRPLPDELLDSSFYIDNNHLNAKGRALFTQRLTEALPQALK